MNEEMKKSTKNNIKHYKKGTLQAMIAEKVRREDNNDNNGGENTNKKRLEVGNKSAYKRQL